MDAIKAISNAARAKSTLDAERAAFTKVARTFAKDASAANFLALETAARRVQDAEFNHAIARATVRAALGEASAPLTPAEETEALDAMARALGL